MPVTPSVQLNVSGARGRSFADVARATGAFGATPEDSDTQVSVKFADYAIQQNPGFKGDPGPPGGSDNTYTGSNGLSAFKASDTDRATASLVGVPNVEDGRFNWTLGNFSGQADDQNIIKANSTALTVGAWVRQQTDGSLYRYDASSIRQSGADTVRRERLNLYDKIPRNLWAGIEAGTDTTDLTSYVLSAINSGRGVSARQGRFTMALNVTSGLGKSIRGEGKHLTYFQNVDNRPVVLLDSSNAHIFEFELEDIWLENRNPTLFPTAVGLKITGAGDGEAWQNDKHHFRNLWFFRFYDNIVCDNRCIWPTFDRIESTGAIRDAMHVEVAANVNQWSIRDTILKGAGRHALFIKHDYDALATGWSMSNLSLEDSKAEALRLTGTRGIQGFGIDGFTLENNAQQVAPGSTSFVDGIRRRKAQIHSDMRYLIGLDINRTTFYNNDGGGAGGNPDWHVYVSGFDGTNQPVIEQSGEIRNSRFLPTQPTGGDVTWPIGLTYGANNLNSGANGRVLLDESRGSIDMRKFTPTDNYSAPLTLTGVTGAPMGLASFVRQGTLITANIPLITGTSNSTSATLTGLPEALRPSVDRPIQAIVQDSTGITMGLMTVQSGGNIVLSADVGGGAFTSSGTKGVRPQTVTWTL
jgi:hypothetical protein